MVCLILVTALGLMEELEVPSQITSSVERVKRHFFSGPAMPIVTRPAIREIAPSPGE